MTSRRARLAIFVVLAFVGGIALYWVVTQGPGRQVLSPRGSTVADFKGTGDLTTATFEVREGWAVHWESKGTRFALAIRGSRDFGTIIDINEPGSGVTSPVGGGTFRIEVASDGAWTITVTQGD